MKITEKETIVSQSNGFRLQSEYMTLRAKAIDERPEDESTIRHIQQLTKAWILSRGIHEQRDYLEYDKEAIADKILALVEYLASNFSNFVSQSELEATELFVESTFALYDEVMSDDYCCEGNLSYAFLVPGRASVTNDQYGAESELIIPALRYVPNEFRSSFIHGVPPFILDYYLDDTDGNRGAVVCVLVSPEDTFYNNEPIEALEIMRKNINNGAKFANRLGAQIVGQGAIIPRITNYGESIDFNDDLVKTTGHAGTSVLVREILNRAKSEEYIDEEALDKIGIVGLGIGTSIAYLLGLSYPGSEIRLFDKNPERIRDAVKFLGSLGVKSIASESLVDLFCESRTIISAVSGTIDLQQEGIEDLSGKFIIDDSQPGSLKPEEVSSLGGEIAWVVGTDNHGITQRKQWGYGTFADERRDLFGCEIETSVLYRWVQDLRQRGMDEKTVQELVKKAALNSRVTPNKAKIWSGLFKRFDFGPAKLQRFGKYLND